MKNITIIHCPVGKPATIRTIGNDLIPMQALVGGYIEVVPLPQYPGHVLIVNEEGNLISLPPNRTVGGVNIVGDFFLCKTDGSEFTSVDPKMVEMLIAIFNGNTSACRAIAPIKREPHLLIVNDERLITETNFWETEPANKGFFYLSLNAGTARLLIPNSMKGHIADMKKGSKYVVLSFLQKAKWQPWQPVVEWMVEDGSQSPWNCHLSLNQLDRFPLEDDVGKEKKAAVWECKNGKPHLSFELPCYVQIVPEIPWLKKIEQ